MKAVLCFVLVLVYINDSRCMMTEAQVKNAVKLIRNLCQPKTKVTNAQIDSMHQGQFSEEPNLMCYMECVLRTGQIVKDGKINSDGLRSQIANLPPALSDSTAAAIENCKDFLEKGNEKCKAAFDFYKCVFEFNPEKFFLP